MTTIDTSKASKVLPQDDGSQIVLIERLAAAQSVPDEDVENNIYRVSSGGDVLWQLRAGTGVYPRSPFTGIYWAEDGSLTGYRWDGTEHAIDLKTGIATLLRLAK